ncbi:MAG TPA: methyltransferase domain-containing protein [Vicinamibacterales bacterium]
MTLTLLACSVKGCHRPLTRVARAYACDGGHSFDVARSGYVNLLQPQDRRSPTAGDPVDALDARVRLVAAGVGRAVLDAAVTLALSPPAATLAVVDLGCGAGDAIGALTASPHVTGVGIDLSVAAVTLAARRFPSATWVVANADRRVPIRDACMDVVLSIHGRRNAAECARVVRPGGRLVVAVPGPEDLQQLRAVVQGHADPRHRTEAVVAEHAPAFALVATDQVREHHTLTGSILEDLLRATYRSARKRSVPSDVLEAGLAITMASDVLVFTRTP